MCVLRLSGPYKELSSSIVNTFAEFTEAISARKDRESGRTTEQDQSTFNCTVSNENGDCVPAQITDAISFLTRHRTDIKELRSRSGVEQAILDFAWDFPRESTGQFNRLPLLLLELCTELRLEIKVTVYGVASSQL
ncbi:hypothetical protein Pan161_08270 [Gimesia algae]|uniref:Uncharacterized protein n=1 Tax=Gimesia algae TaxID=2527971 RepID=A0A517V871_9PLAN|nr:hypothetical protein Pan161_08270 [Gimesia algae]